jgi:LPS export ABC transporter protein LptC
LNIPKLKVKKLNLFWIIFVSGLVACQASLPNSPPQTSKESRLDTQLVLNNAILEQSNQQTSTIWKIKAANIVYSEDKKTATLDKVVGNLIKDGKIIFQISAEIGKVQDNGNVIILNKQIIASDPRNNSVIKTSAVEWRPQENLVLIKDNFTAIDPNLEVTAAEGKYFTDIESLEIQGEITATTKKPALQLMSDRLVWNIPQAQVKSPGSIQIVRYDQDEKITDKLVSDRAEVNLAKHTATLNNNIELVSLQPNLQIATDSLTWNYQERVGNTKTPIQILDRDYPSDTLRDYPSGTLRDRHLSFTGNQGEVNLQQQMVKLTDGVRGINQQKASKLYARQLTWKLDTKKIEAIGNVIYEQADPQVRVTGEKAIGNLEDNNIVVTSSNKKQVTSVINN